jgi:acetate kinase
VDVAALMPASTVLVANAGSSSVKLSVLDADDRVLARRALPAIGELSRATVAAEVRSLLDDAGGCVDVTAHRIVHGGVRFTDPVVIDASVRQALGELTQLAPLHQPKSLSLLDAVTSAVPDTPAVACFDTAFHSTLPPAAFTYAVPHAWRARWGVRRYGFHGLSHAYAARRASDLLDGAARRLVTCHLGAGASLTAVVDGRSVDTTMGFTPLEGLVMATRSGSVDPGLVLWLEEHEGLRPHEVASVLEHDSGLTALAGTGDMRAIEQRAAAGDADAAFALEVYEHRLVTSVAAMAAAAGGIDALVFTGGAGERSARLRAVVAERLSWLGVEVDQARNADGPDDRDISTDSARVRTLVVSAREDLEMARQARDCRTVPTR